MPTVYNGGQSLLEKYAIEGYGTFKGRDSLIAKNIYNNAAPANEYSATNTRAIADTTTPHYGKGTGNFLDINNYAAGSDWDIFGNQSNAIGSGRNPAFAQNFGTFGYDPTHAYKQPNMSKNIGQVII
jgi:hypothetical protein